MNKTKISAQIVADSLSPQGDRLTSLLITFPRIILAEVNTHRMLSKNTSSSRAIPFNKMIEAVQNDPFIPIAWQKDHKGMQGSEYLVHTEANIEDWLKARDYAIEYAENLNNGGHGVTKQLCNRLLEPFMWTTMLVTGSREGWENFFKLRNPVYNTKFGIFSSKKDAINCEEDETGGTGSLPKEDDVLEWLRINKGQAEIHMMALAESIWDAMNESTPRQLQAGEWHIPFETEIVQLLTKPGSGNHSVFEEWIMDKVKVSVAMAARTSYTVVGEEKEIDWKKMIGLHDRLIAQNPPHSSPMEHACVCVTDEDYNKSFKGEEKGWFRNYKGFKSYRYLIENK